jgi:hypothetical protein
MTHDCYSLDDILKTEPNYLQRIGLETPPGYGYARYTLYDLTNKTWPMIAAWFNPLVAYKDRWIPGDQPAANRFSAGIPNTGDYHSTPSDIDDTHLNQFFNKLAATTGVSPDKMRDNMQTLAGARVEVDTEPNEFCLSKVVTTLPDGRAVTGVSCTAENFNRAIDMLVGVVGVTPDGATHRATAGDLQPFRDAQHLPYITRGEKTEPLFRMFGVRGDTMSLAVQGFAKRMGF